MSSLQWLSGSCSHVGNVREVNEDACLNQPESGIWAVADGMGGHLQGDVASNKTIEALARLVRVGSLDDRIDQIAEALETVNHDLVEMVSSEEDVCGTTVAILVIDERKAACLWAGDSRIYRFRNGALEQLTIDHVGQVGDASDVDGEIESDQYLTRAIGADYGLVLDLCDTNPADGDRYLICSDGLYGEIPEETITQILAGTGAPTQAARRLIDITLDSACNDNVTAIVIDFEDYG